MIKYRKIFSLALICLILAVSWTTSIAQKLSDRAQISILTIGPGTSELYAAFGHSAIRVTDPEYGYDAAFNYGTFDFNQPNFYLNFAKGYLVYKLSVQDAKALINYYERSNRSVDEQTLNLTQEQKQKVFSYLVKNARPENANYYYDYFYDNCATKIGDVFIEALGDDFRFDESYVDEPGLTIRELTDRYSADWFPWGKLGIDLCLGMPMDKKLTNLQYMYLPDYVAEAFDMAQVNLEGKWTPVVEESSTLFDADNSNHKGPFFTPKLVFWLAAILIALLSFFSLKNNSSLRLLDFAIFLIYGLLGLFLLLLWVATDHAAAAWNLNLLWAWPTHLFAAGLLLKKTKPRWMNWYLLVTALFGILLILAWPILPQALNQALIPITLIIAIRSAGAILE
jgi:hypothetical protein